jgi:hypothetical protein
MGRVKDHFIELEQAVLDGDECARRTLLSSDVPQALWGIDEKFDQIANYVDRGWSIVPQLPGQKKPAVKWKQYQINSPRIAEIYYWFRRWPDAGPAVVLGPGSNLFAIDVDGEEAHDELVRRLGEVPRAPTVRSGSGKPYRYHLFFKHPAVPTNAKATPWHPKLEFRGHGGIIILPPALHKTGNHYQWAPGKSLIDLPVPHVPERVVSALGAGTKPKRSIAAHQAGDRGADHRSRVVLSPGIARKTRAFLQGRFAHAGSWNDRLFRAACDLAGNCVPLDRALPLLLAGAAPWDEQEEAKAIATIQSAYSSSRIPARLYAARRRPDN